jgi:hypothetical protein
MGDDSEVWESAGKTHTPQDIAYYESKRISHAYSPLHKSFNFRQQVALHFPSTSPTHTPQDYKLYLNNGLRSPIFSSCASV